VVVRRLKVKRTSICIHWTICTSTLMWPALLLLLLLLLLLCSSALWHRVVWWAANFVDEPTAFLSILVCWLWLFSQLLKLFFLSFWFTHLCYKLDVRYSSLFSRHTKPDKLFLKWTFSEFTFPKCMCHPQTGNQFYLQLRKRQPKIMI